MTVLGVIGLLVNFRYNLIPTAFLSFLVVLVVAALAARWYLAHDFNRDDGLGLLGGGTLSNTPISPTDAADRVQQYLEDHEFRRPLDYSPKNRNKIHEDTDWVYANGEEKLFYGVIGKEKDYEGKNKENTIRVIWNCTDDCLWTFDSYVPGQHRTNPLFGKERWSKTEGYRGKRGSRKRNQGGTQVFIQQGDNETRDED